jgi:ribosome recycling factor
MIKEALTDAEHRMKGAITSLEEDLAGIRTGRAHPALIEKLSVEYYGAPTPLQQLAAISAPEPQMLTVRPFDPGTLAIIEKAIRNSDLGINPNSDGKMIRLIMPAPTEERRRDMVKMVHKRLEEAKVAVRNIRRDVQDDLREYEKEKLISEDELESGRTQLQKLTDQFTSQIDETGKRKEHEIMEV